MRRFHTEGGGFALPIFYKGWAKIAKPPPNFSIFSKVGAGDGLSRIYEISITYEEFKAKECVCSAAKCTRDALNFFY